VLSNFLEELQLGLAERRIKARNEDDLVGLRQEPLCGCRISLN
jgi:hypothetical protein